MIDAYEIGIELALQDGVSAGLRVIAQGLGMLDRAVAATVSAGRLEVPTAVALTAAAQGAAQAVAAAGAILGAYNRGGGCSDGGAGRGGRASGGSGGVVFGDCGHGTNGGF